MGERAQIYNEDCMSTMDRIGKVVDLIITSPPYNMTSRKGGYADSGRYDVYIDWKSEEEYIKWTLEVFEKFNKVLKDNKLVIYNFNYSIENPSLPYKVVSAIEKQSNFTLVDTIVWKKKAGLPFPANKYRLSRNWEFVFVFCRKDNVDKFDIFKSVSSISNKTKQVYYKNFYNYIEAKNNDGKTPFNQATFSSDLIEQLLTIYGTDNYIVYDPFSGTGTTGVACIRKNMNYIGSEISKMQCEYAENRINKAFYTRETTII